MRALRWEAPERGYCSLLHGLAKDGSGRVPRSRRSHAGGRDRGARVAVGHALLARLVCRVGGSERRGLGARVDAVEQARRVASARSRGRLGSGRSVHRRRCRLRRRHLGRDGVGNGGAARQRDRVGSPDRGAGALRRRLVWLRKSRRASPIPIGRRRRPRGRCRRPISTGSSAAPACEGGWRSALPWWRRSPERCGWRAARSVSGRCAFRRAEPRKRSAGRA